MSAVRERSVAIVGLGATGRAYVEAVDRFPELSLQSVVEPDSARLTAELRKGVRGFPSLDHLIRRRAIPDLAVLCAPPGAHLDTAVRLLQGGADLLVERPLATIPSDAEQITEVAERLGRTLVTAARLRGERALEMARARIDAGAIGRLRYVECTLSAKHHAASGWRSDEALSGGGVWMHLGPDALDAVEMIAGPIERIRMTTSAEQQGAGIEDDVSVETRHANEVTAELRLSWNRQLEAPLARCVGELGEIRVGWSRSSLRTSSGQTETFKGCEEGLTPDERLRSVLDECLRGEPRESHGAAMVSWLHAAYRSQRDARWQYA
jgi:predicted dehydrogenase